jgi:DNA polymerase I-like protein with 3'-5' exonuclease and polymerase domains
VASGIISGPFTRIEPEPFNINSFGQVKDYLLSQGWKPDSFTEKGSPQLTESSFHTVTGAVPQLITRRSVLMHRKRMLKNTTKEGDEKGLINLVREDGRITAGGIPQGTPTGRYRHTGVVNIPKASDKVVYGREIRSLFIPRPGYVFVGCDESALEARCEAHYCYDFPGGPEYAAELLEGDIHTKNAEMLGCSRDVAKTFKYAISYGAQPQKIADSVGCKLNKARRLYNAFWQHNTALAALRDTVIQSWEKRGGNNGGYLKGLDGRKLYGRSPHSLVNLLFQSAGSILVKTATCFINNWIEKEGLDAKQVLHFHDEFQLEVHPDDVDRVKELAVKAFEAAGKYHKFNVPITGEAKVGDSWASTH